MQTRTCRSTRSKATKPITWPCTRVKHCGAFVTDRPSVRSPNQKATDAATSSMRVAYEKSFLRHRPFVSAQGSKRRDCGVGPGEEIVDTVVRMSVDDFRDDVDQVDVWVNAEVG